MRERVARGSFEHDGVWGVDQRWNAWGAYCPDLPGVGVVGDSREEVERLIRESISFHLEGLRQAGDPVPEPTAVGSTRVQIPAA
jgi:predicted RNase H-like HicB family nuclease